MPSTVVEVAYVNQPRPGAKMGSIKGADGVYYGVPPAMLGLIQQHGVYDIFYEDHEYQGKTYHSVKSLKPVTKTAAAAESVMKSAAGGVQRAPTNPVDARRMFICGALNAALHGQGLEAIQAGPLGEAVEALDVVWRSKQALGREKTELADEMDDDIPY